MAKLGFRVDFLPPLRKPGLQAPIEPRFWPPVITRTTKSGDGYNCVGTHQDTGREHARARFSSCDLAVNMAMYMGRVLASAGLNCIVGEL